MTRTAQLLCMIACFIITLACGTSTQPIAPTAIHPTSTGTIHSPAALSVTPATINTVLPTDTSVPVVATSPAASSTDASSSNSHVATAAASLGFSIDLMNNRSLFTDPVGMPIDNWHDLPIMSQATDGQEFTPEIYSYKADATLQQAQQFYTNKIADSGWNCLAIPGTSGEGNPAGHDIILTCGTLSISISSFDNDTQHVLVILSVPKQ